MPKYLHISAATGLLAGLLGMGSGAVPQAVEPGGLQVSVDFSSAFRYDDNLNLTTPSLGSSAYMTHRLAIGLTSETRTQSFSAGLGGALRYGNITGAGTPTGLGDPNAFVNYQRIGANSALSLNSFYREEPVRSLNPDDFIDNNQDLITDSGSRIAYGAGAELALGADAPFGAVIGGRIERRDYSGVTDPDLYANDTASVYAKARLEFSPTLEGRLEARHTEYQAQDLFATHRQTLQVGFGLSGYVNPTTTFDAALYQNRITTTLILPPTTRISGVSGTFSLSQKRTNGDATATLSRSFDTSGTRHSLSLGRNMELPRGAFSASLGATQIVGGQTYLIGGLKLSHEMARGVLSSSISRSVQTSTTSSAIEVTQARLSYQHFINEVSSLAVSFSYADSNGVGVAPATDRERAYFRIAYNRELTADWLLSGGYEMQQSATGGAAAARSNAIFLTLDRSFRFFP